MLKIILFDFSQLYQFVIQLESNIHPKNAYFYLLGV